MKVKQKTDRQKADVGKQNKENTRTFTKARENKRQRGKTSVCTGVLGNPDF